MFLATSLTDIDVLTLTMYLSLHLVKATTCSLMRGRSSCESHYFLSPKSLSSFTPACLRTRGQYPLEAMRVRLRFTLLQAPPYCEPQFACFKGIVDISLKPFLLGSNRDFEGVSQDIYLAQCDNSTSSDQTKLLPFDLPFRGLLTLGLTVLSRHCNIK